MGERTGRTTRRSALASVGTAVGALLSGCGGLNGPRTNSPISILAAGSLNRALEQKFKPDVDGSIRVEAHGSAQVAQMVASGQKSPDIVVVADTALFNGPLHPNSYGEFATNSLVLAYNSATDGGRRVGTAGRDDWYEALLADTVRFGRTDPDLDPLGYRTLFMLELASRYYKTDVSVREQILATEQIYPETQLITQFETGAIDAAVTYRSMAVERGYDYIDLPAEIDYSHPEYVSSWYKDCSYTLSSGKTISGDLISYGAAVRNREDATMMVYDELITGSFLQESGFGLPETYPRYK